MKSFSGFRRRKTLERSLWWMQGRSFIQWRALDAVVQEIRIRKAQNWQNKLLDAESSTTLYENL